jgi:RimJ/RimL family protein N-acetyltransferase
MNLNIAIDEELCLRPFVLDDLQAYIDCQLTEEAKIGFTSFPVNDEHEKNTLKDIILQYSKEKPSDITLAILYKEQFVGFVGLEELNTNTYEHKGMICYCVHSQFKNKNIATRAVKAMTSFGFDDLKLIRIWGLCQAQNEASKRVLEKAGYTREALLKKNCRYEVVGIVDELLYAIVK